MRVFLYAKAFFKIFGRIIAHFQYSLQGVIMTSKSHPFESRDTINLHIPVT